MAIADDTVIDYTNKIIDLTGTTVYDVSVLYSYCKEQFKLSTNIDDDFAWTANTPTDFTLKNGWYLRRHSIRRLKNGSITANYGTDEIEKISFSAITTDPIESDIGIDIRDDTVVIGELVDYDVDDSRMVWWVRTNGTATSVATGSTVDSLQGGTPSGTSTGTSEDDTQDLWTNINTIGGLAATGPQPLMYVYTGDLGTGDFAGNARKNVGWDDDPDPALTNADRGALDVLINIVDAGVTIGNPAGNITVYGRQGLDKYADFTIDISAGGRISVPIAQSNDGEDTIGEVAVAIDGRNATDPVAGEIITWATNQSAELVEFIEGANSTNGIIIMRGLTEYPANNTALTFSGGATGTTRGTVGGILLQIDAETAQADEADYGNLLTGGTSSSTMTLRSHLTLTETGTGVAWIIGESRHDRLAFPADYTAFVDNDNMTGTGVDVTLDLAGRPQDRLCFDLDDVTFHLAAFDLTVADSSGFAVGQNVSQTVTLAKGTVLEIPDGTSIIVSQNSVGGAVWTTGNVINEDDGAATEAITGIARVSTFNYTLPLQSSQVYNGLIDLNGRSVAEGFHYLKYLQQANSVAARSDPNGLNADPDQEYFVNMMKQELGGGTLILQSVEGDEYRQTFFDEDTPANDPVAQSQDSRIAVKPGAVLTAGEGIAIINPSAGDANNIRLVDTSGVTHAPLVSVPISLTNLVSGDHIAIVLDDGTGQEDEDQFTSGVGNAVGDTDFVVTGTLPNDTPVGGSEDIILKVTDVSSTSIVNRQMRYRGASFSGSTVTLVAGESGTADVTNADPLILEDTGAFGATTIEVGDPIRNILDGSIAWVTEIIDANTIRTTQLEGGTSNDWVSGDTWETNTLVVAYVSATDTAYIPYMDRVADAATESETLTFVSTRNIIARVRNTSIDDFDTSGSIQSPSGFTARAVRNTDNVFAPT